MERVSCDEQVSLFAPTQPVMRFHSDQYIECQPENQQQREVALYYQFRTGEEGRMPIFPDGCLDFLFCCDAEKPKALLAVSPEQRTFYTFERNCEYFGVRLYPEQCCFKFKNEVKEFLTQQQIPLFDILKIDVSILEKIVEKRSFMERIAVFQQFMGKIQLEFSCDHRLISYCVKKMYSTDYTSINMNQLSEETGYSDRYIRKKFEEYIGFSPKQFSQIIRFQQTVSEMLGAASDTEGIISDRGFYDQSHFYKGFKKYAKLTPKQFRSMISRGFCSEDDV